MSEVGEGFKGRVIDVVDVYGERYKFYNMGFYPGNTVIVIYRGDRESILRIGRKIVKVSNDVFEKVLVVEDSGIYFVEWS